jgi:hypothetical protein
MSGIVAGAPASGGREVAVFQRHAQSELELEPLDPHLQAELDRYYWESDEPAEMLAARFDIELPPGTGPRRVPASTRLAEFVTPLDAPGGCPRCDTQLVFLSRADLRDDHRSCLFCGHSEPAAACDCERCCTERAERGAARHLFWRQRLCRADYARFALDELDRDATTLYWALCYLASRDDRPVSWEDARTLSGVRDLDAPAERLVRAHLVFLHEGRFELNPLTPAAVRSTPHEDAAWRPYAAALQHGRGTDAELLQLLEHVVPEFRSLLADGDDRGVETALDDGALTHPDLVTRAVREATRRYVGQARPV